MSGRRAARSGSAALIMEALSVLSAFNPACDSLHSTGALKRDAHGITAEDVGKFPDTNLAEAMQRISGVAIARGNGEGAKITVRSFGPDYNMILLNGRQMPATTVQSTSASNSRAFDFGTACGLWRDTASGLGSRRRRCRQPPDLTLFAGTPARLRPKILCYN